MCVKEYRKRQCTCSYVHTFTPSQRAEKSGSMLPQSAFLSFLRSFCVQTEGRGAFLKNPGMYISRGKNSASW